MQVNGGAGDPRQAARAGGIWVRRGRRVVGQPGNLPMGGPLNSQLPLPGLEQTGWAEGPPRGL